MLLGGASWDAVAGIDCLEGRGRGVDGPAMAFGVVTPLLEGPAAFVGEIKGFTGDETGLEALDERLGVEEGVVGAIGAKCRVGAINSMTSALKTPEALFCRFFGSLGGKRD